MPSPLTEVRSKLETLAWFVKRPAMYRELGRRIARGRVRTAASDEAARVAKEAAQNWCRGVAMPLGAALERIGAGGELRPLADEKPALWRAALDAYGACRGTMGGPAHVDLLYHMVLKKRPSRFVETGVAAGWSSLAVLAAMETLGHGQLTSIDMPYPKRDNEDLVGCVVPASLRHRWSLVRLPDRDGLPAALRTPIGAAHYDSDKSAEGRAFAYPLLWNALEPGGVLFSDDVEDNFAFRDFARDIGSEPLVIEKGPGNYAGVLLRP